MTIFRNIKLRALYTPKIVRRTQPHIFVWGKSCFQLGKKWHSLKCTFLYILSYVSQECWSLKRVKKTTIFEYKMASLIVPFKLLKLKSKQYERNKANPKSKFEKNRQTFLYRQNLQNSAFFTKLFFFSTKTS